MTSAMVQAQARLIDSQMSERFKPERATMNAASSKSATASIYLRISSDRSGERAGVTRQKEDCERRARERGWMIHAIHEDNDLSARSGKRRPGFEALLDDVESGAVSVVVAWALDRLQRNRRDELRLYEACQRAGVTLSLVNGADLDFSTAAGRFVADSLGSVARLEVEMKSDRQCRAQEQAAKQGRRSGGRRPFGYEADGVTVREREAEAVRAAYTAYLSGVPLARIAKDWNEAGLHSDQRRFAKGHEGEPSVWTGQTVGVVLRNPRNAGKRVYKGEVVADAVWPAIVAEETWAAAVGRMKGQSPAPRKLARRLLSGLARCGVCGAPAWGGGAARRGFGNYRCRDNYGHFARMSEPVDDYVSNVLLERLARPDAADLMRREETVDTAALHSEYAALRTRLDSVAIDFADGVIERSQLRTITTRIQSRLTEMDGELADAGRVNVLGPMLDADTVEAGWDALSLDHRRAVIDLLCNVTIHPPGRGVRTFRPESVGVEWKVA